MTVELWGRVAGGWFEWSCLSANDDVGVVRSAARVENTAGERFLFDDASESAGAETSEVVMGTPSEAGSNRRAAITEPTHRRTMRRRQAAKAPLPMTVSLGNVHTLLGLSLTSVYLDQLVLPQPVQVCDVAAPAAGSNGAIVVKRSWKMRHIIRKPVLAKEEN
jgi:hypothetical protein